VEVKEPSCDFYSCADALPHRDPAEIRRLLVRGLISPVRFVEAVRRVAADGVAAMVEVGPGTVLRGLVRQTDPQIQLWAVRSDDEAGTVADEAGALAGT
ncbi:MAG: hypothetical protein ACRDIA_08195, partial [Actinomycetota bacterium]